MMMMQKSNLRRLLLCLCCLFFLVLCALKITRFLAELVSVSESKSQESIVAEESQNKFRALASNLDLPAIDTSTASTGMTSRQEKSCSNFGYHSTYNAHNFSTITVIPEILSPAIASLQWIGSPPHRSLILLQYTTNESHVTKSNIFRSQVNGSMVNETCRFQPDSVIDSFFVSKNPNKVIFRDLINDRLYVTTDAGNNFDYSDQLEFTPDIIQFSDIFEDYLFAIDYATNSLYMSTQLGISDSWKKLSTSVEAAYWTQLKDGQDFDDPTAIYFTELNTQSGKYKVKKAVFPYLNLSTCEFCQSIGEVTNFKLVHEYIFVIKNIDNGLTTLFVSYKRQSFIQARFIPAMGGNEQYSVVDASQGQVLLAVVKDNTNADLYISDERGTNYSLSLQNIITNNFQWNSGIESFDFYLVKGTRGTYIANVAVINSQPFYQTTVISFNKGANWSPLTAPLLDSDMSPVECYYPDCSFHLDMHNSGIVSKESAVGMIMATGTLGWNYSQGIGLYLSYDGGFSWRELFKGNATYLFDIMDSGSTILVAHNTEYAREFMISYDAGFSWQHYNICTFGVNIIGLHTEMGDTASLTTFYGSVNFPYASYVVINLDMSQLNIVECKDDLDYITWMPSDGRMGDRCVLGAKFRYRKRKLGHWCRNKPNYWIPSEPAICICTIEDFGCDIGFEHIDYNSPCTPVDNYPCVPTDYNFGYRRIPGDECVSKNNNFFFNKLDLCSNGIFEFYVNATPSPAAVDQPITFIVTVNGTHQLEATYYFLYGDSSHEISTANIVAHSYSIPGYFSVKVFVSTATGNSSTTIGVFVENEIVDANVHVLHFASNTYFFAVEIQCKSNKTVLDCRSNYYEWNFTSLYLGRLDVIVTINTTSPLLNYEFLYDHSYHYDLWVYNAVSIVHKQGEFTAKDEKTIHAIISGPNFALVNSTVKFYGNVDLLMPNSIIYRWTIISHNDGTVLKNFTGTDATLHVVFDRTGTYEITMEGLGSQNHIVIFNASATIIIAAIYNFQLIATPSIVAVNQTVVLSVTKVSNVENFIYLFLFGDKQPSVQTSNNSVVHSYSVAGSYQASVTIEGIGTSVHFETVIIVQDKINTICVDTYVKLLTVTYIVIIDCGASSDHTYGTIQYIWDFNNGKNITASLSTIITTYQSTGVYNFSLLASNNVSQKSYTGQIYVDAKPDNTNVKIIITGPRFALVNVTVIFSISSKIPVIFNLMYNWTIIDQETNQVYVNKESNKLVIKFFKPSNYKVFASVNYSGSLFSSSHTISVESNLSYIKVDCPPIIEVAQQKAIFIHLYGIHNDSYKEFVNISITSDTQTIMLQYVKSPIIVKTYLSYSVNNIYAVDVLANNHVSEASTNFSVEVVRTNTTLLLEFSVVALSQANVSYETTSWRKQFSDVIDVSLTNENSLLDWQLIVTAGSVRDYLEMFVDILPVSSSLTALANATMIAEQFINVVNSNYKFSLPSSSLSISVSNAAIIGLQQELSENPTRVKSSKNDNNGTSLELGIGIGLGVPVLIVIVISILLGIIFYKRKIHSKKQYRKLGDSNRTSFSINDEANNGLDRTIDASMDETELEL